MNHAFTNRIASQAESVADSTSEMMSAGLQSARETIAMHPTTAVMAAFGAGLGIGLGLAIVMSSRPAPIVDPSISEKIAKMLSEHLPWQR